VLHLNVLGAPVLLGPSGPVSGRAAYKRRIALLAILAVARRRPVGRERLIGLLWPENPADAARHTLSESLYVLRKELGENVFLAVGDDLTLSPEAIATDVGAFGDALEERRLEDAVAAYGGPFLDGFYVADAPEFEHWVDGERDRLARAFAQALEALAVRAEGEGRLLDSAEWWRRLAAHDPCSARVAVRLAEVLDAAGERAAALRALAVHGARVRADLEMDPEPAVQALEHRLRTVPAAPPPAADPLPPPAAVSRHAAADADPETRAADDEESVPVPPRLPSAHTGAPIPVPTPVRTDDAARPPALPETRVRRTRDWRPRWGPAAAVAVPLLVLAAAALVPSLARGPAPTPAGERYDPRRIAVLYFDDQSPNGDLGYLAAGLTGELIDQLSDVPALDVVSRNGVKAYRDGEVSFDSLVARLQVGSVVEGTVQRSGDSVRVTVQLVDTNRARQLERRTVILPAGDLFALERSVGDEVTGFLRRRLGQEVRVRQAAEETRSAEALAFVFRAEAARDEAGRMARRGHALDQGSAARLLARADTFLAGAHAADPAWARPVVLRGVVALSRADLVPAPARAALHEAAAGYARRALALAPDDAAALALRGRVSWRLAMDAAGTPPDTTRVAAAERDLRAAVEADSSMASAWAALSQLLRLRGKLAESDAAARRALGADAFLEEAGPILSRLYFNALTEGDYAQAGRWCAQGRAQFPADWRFVECRLSLARADPSLPPDPARAWALVAELDRLDPPARATEEGRGYARVYRQAAVAAVLARAGAADSARAMLARAREHASGHPDSRVSFLYDEAYATLLMGDSAGARRLIDAYLRARPELREYVARKAALRSLFTP
jgi:DNA-binding SARP family transcriptional activator/TolB-like protein